jgi:hypothetical protein
VMKTGQGARLFIELGFLVSCGNWVPTRNHVHHRFNQIRGGIWFGFGGSYDLGGGGVFPIEVGWQLRSEGDDVGSGSGWEWSWAEAKWSGAAT